jgi:hypothetical protein
MRLLLAASLLFVAAAAHAEGAVAVVAVGGCAAGTSAAHARALREALARHEGGVQSEAETARPLGGLARQAQAEVERQLAAARADFLHQDTARAEAAVAAAQEGLAHLPPGEARWKSQQDAASLAAWMAQKQGNQAAAEQALGAVVAVEPDFAPDHKLFPPTVDKVARAVAARLKAQPQGTLSVTTQPAGLPVFVDGKPVGAGPVALKLPRGAHRVEAGFAPGQRGLPREVQLEDSAAVELDRRFEGALWADAGPCLEAGPDRAQRLDALVKLGHLLQVKTLVTVREEEASPNERYLVGTAVDAEGGQELRDARTKLTEGAELANALDKLAGFIATGDAVPPLEQVKGEKGAPPAVDLAAAHPEPAPAAAGGLTRSAPAPSNGLRTGAYVAGGVAVAALLASGYFALDLKSANDTVGQGSGGAFGSGSNDAVKDALSRQGRDQTLAWVGAGVGVAAGAAAVVMYLYSAPEGGSGSAASGTVHFTGSGLAGSF